MIGEVLGSYRIVQKLGAGGMGEVYLAEHQVMDRKAAIKVLRPEASANASLVTRFFAEARAADVIRHPGIVQILDCAMPAAGRAYIAMEYLEGETLGATLARVGLIEEAATLFDISWQIADALAAAHAKGIVHRDLKPDNVFLTPETTERRTKTRVKVLDFGIAKLTYDSQVQTQTGSILGTPLYMSPEQARGAGKVDHRSDIYSLGCIMFEMICGRPPFVREGIGDLIIAHASEMAPSAASLQTALPSEIDRLIASMLAKPPEARPQSMSDVAAILSAYRERSNLLAQTRDLPRSVGGHTPAQSNPGSSTGPVPRGVLSEERHPSVLAAALVLPDVPGMRLPGDPDPRFGPSGTHLLPPGESSRGPASTLSSSASELNLSRTRVLGRRSRGAAIVAAGLVAGGAVVALALPLARTRSHTAGTASVERQAPAAPIPPAAVLPTPAAPPTAAPVATSPHAVVAEPEQPSEEMDEVRTSDTVRSPSRSRSASQKRGTSGTTVPPILAAARKAFAAGDFVAASIEAKRAAREGGGAAAFVLLGDSLARLEQLQDATDAYNAALEIDASNAAARKALRRLKTPR